jgi:protein TonB
MVLVDVGVLGTPSDVRLLRSSGYSALDQAAIRAVREWRFRPGTMAGMAVASSVSIPVRFELH